VEDKDRWGIHGEYLKMASRSQRLSSPLALRSTLMPQRYRPITAVTYFSLESEHFCYTYKFRILHCESRQPFSP
jgi:hypothetical protein